SQINFRLDMPSQSQLGHGSIDTKIECITVVNFSEAVGYLSDRQVVVVRCARRGVRGGGRRPKIPWRAGHERFAMGINKIIRFHQGIGHGNEELDLICRGTLEVETVRRWRPLEGKW